MRSVRERLGDIWAIIRGRDPWYAERDPYWRRDDPPLPGDEDDALVPAGPPRRPLLSGAVELPLPEPDVELPDARGPALDDPPGDASRGRAA